MYGASAPLVRSRAPRYAKAVDDLIDSMGMPDEIQSLLELEQLSTLNPYFAEERSLRWRTFFSECSPSERLVASTKRRIWMYFGLARLKRTCAYCWVPMPCCMCESILDASQNVPIAMASGDGLACDVSDGSSLPPRPQCKVTIILHAQEILRMTNSAHIAAMAMNAGMLVWGLPEHDERISSLGRYWVANPPPKGCGLGWPIDHSSLSFDGTSITTSSCEQHGLSSDDLSSFPSVVSEHQKRVEEREGAQERTKRRFEKYLSFRSSITDISEGLELDEDELADTQDMSVLLYPAVDASIPFAQLLAYREGLARPGNADGQASAGNEMETFEAVGYGELDDIHSKIIENNSATCVKKAPPALHIYLSDGTWSQARVVNKHINPQMPRVALEISPRYGALFQGLRKRTRESGVSTLEATTIAVSQAVARDTLCAVASNIPDSAGNTCNLDSPQSQITVCSITSCEATNLHENVAILPEMVLRLETEMFNAMRLFVATVSLISSKSSSRCSGETQEEKEEEVCGSFSKESGQSTAKGQSVLSPERIREICAGEHLHQQIMQKMRENAFPRQEMEAVRKLMPAPVTNFCYVCDIFVGFELMTKHVVKPTHVRRCEARQPLPFDPSPESKNIWKFKNKPHAAGNCAAAFE